MQKGKGMKSKGVIAVIVAATLPLFYPLYIYYEKNISLPFKCLYTTEYTSKIDEGDVRLRITHDLRIYSKGQNYLVLNGTANYKNMTYRVARTILLGQQNEIEGKTFRFSTEKVVKSPGDNSPDIVVDSILQEYYVTPGNTQIDIFPLHGRTYLIGGPYAFVSVCLRY